MSRTISSFRLYYDRVLHLRAVQRKGFKKSFSSCRELVAEIDSYGGVVVKEDLSKIEINDFNSKLNYSLMSWKESKRRGVWLRIPASASSLIPTALQNGFWFHHCREDYILLCTWLAGDRSTSMLPRGPSHYIGVAGFVMNSQDDLLMIKEKDGPAKARNLWKLPGGMLDVSENIAQGVVREVREETGMNCEFLQLASIVESHNGTGPMRETSSDLYCISVLKALDEKQVLIPQAKEIEACEWIPISDALAFPLYAPNTSFGESFRSALHVRNEYMRSVGSSSIGMLSQTLPAGIGRRVANVLYYKRKHE